MRPPADLETQMTHLTGFTQKEPEDGRPASQRTDVYLGYDPRNLYVVFIAHDDEPDKMRARVSRREAVFGDEIVEIQLDTFNDQRRAFSFVSNPHGIQWDALWTEGRGFDDSWDTVWRSRGRPTDRGYVVLMSIPFKSLRFPATGDQTWGFVLVRDIPRNNESSFWPRVSNRIEGRLNQEATLEGLGGISPGRNVQVIPFATSRSFKVLDTGSARFEEDDFDADIGVDAKLVLKDSLALDITANPDFSQIESDQPQVTVNQRFEVFFPEKRPFFLENSDFFQSPINMLFTRRIADPRVGARLTGKLGPWSLGLLAIDDEAPAKLLDPADPAADEVARFGVVRLSRDVLEQSKVGAFFTYRDFERDRNWVGGIDGRFKLDEHWDTRFQVVQSDTRLEIDDGKPSTSEFSDPAFELMFNRSGRGYGAHFHYRDYGPDFRTDSGFVPRVDLRDIHTQHSYRFRPEGDKLVSWGPRIFVLRTSDHDDLRLEWRAEGEMSWEFRRQTNFGFELNTGRERLRVSDFPALSGPTDFETGEIQVDFRSRFIQPVTIEVELSVGRGINFVPPDDKPLPHGQPPSAADLLSGEFQLDLRPLRRFRIDTRYLYTQLDDAAGGQRVFTNQILRSRWSWQFNRRLSLRAILQFERTDAVESLTRLTDRDRFNGDVLVTYLINPWTAIYLGYNSNYRNIDIVGDPDDPQIVPTENDLFQDSRQLFVKASYLFRP